ncbi:hypothetical protein CAI21_04150 [Alkalilimnicola ehrlichii]|uniref:OmpA-like domain-containing protein n=1 Tax=Alkalilimnicola ehrlichii TaxID=351052 RepID=A0A3E0X1D6_9GAMM|nr:OmpA family protein [Alkalilimnicola ehrlichii]RFA30710.1 hypothetical protein CAI21_04150 [Alkalilimnicola ehrlichii]RFA38287.1 hypothetical protein CAL65_05515 [Alkalilimnicola ehrlichii]
MRQRSRGGEVEVTVIKRPSKKRGHEEEHSGAWKVAFADFTLAMMALFMVLWIVQPLGSSSDEASEPEDGAQRATTPIEGGTGIFDGISRVPVELEDLRVVLPPIEPEDVYGHYNSPEELLQLAELLDRVAAELDAVANLEVEVVPQGLRILIKDDEERYMFERGSAVLDPHFGSLLRRLGEVLRNIDNKIIISGHTDATPYPANALYNNWNLSGDRALRARHELVRAGLPETSILQVTAQADVMPIRPEEPEHGANRRVEMVLLTRAAEALYREIFGDSYTRAQYSSSGAKLIEASEEI